MEAVIISSKPMSLRELIRVIDGDPIEVSDDAYSRIHASRHVVEQILSTGSPVYGLNTGVGEMKDMALPREVLRGFQEMLLRTHAGGVGPPLSRRVVRGAMAVRLNGIARDVMNLMAQRPLLGHGTTAVLEALENAISSVPLPRAPAQVHLAAKEMITDDALLTGKIKSVRERSATKRFT